MVQKVLEKCNQVEALELEPQTTRSEVQSTDRNKYLIKKISRFKSTQVQVFKQNKQITQSTNCSGKQPVDYFQITATSKT